MPEVTPETVAITPALVIASTLEIALLIAGLVVLWRVRFSPAARSALETSYRPLGAWRLLPSDFLAATLFVIFGGLGFQFAVGFIGRGIPALTADPDLWLILQGIAFQLGMLGGAIGGTFYTRSRGNVMPGGDPLKVPLPKAGFLTFLAVLPVVTAVSLLWTGVLQLAGIDAQRQELVDLFVNAESRTTAIVMASFAVLVAPITEELIFRAGLFRYLRTRIPRWAAFVLPAMLFASLHGNLAAFAPLTALGIVFAVAYEHTGRIAVPMIAHALFNLNTILLLLTGVTV
ncbi:MAG TPA: type II CAAX endopeptidase family protein [Opitutaceae bacterium]